MVFELIFFLAKFTILHNSNAWSYGVADECVKGLFLTLKNCQKNLPIANRSLNLLRVNIQLTALLQMKGLQMRDPHNFFKECLWMHHLRKVKKNQKLTVLHPDIWHGGLELINVNVQCGRAH